MAVLAPALPRRIRADIRVEVADGHPIYREGLVHWLRGCEGVELVGQAGDGPTALAHLRLHHPDVAVIDRDLPGVDGAALATIARRERLPTRMLVLASTADGPAAFRALSSGVAAYLTKDTERAELHAALDAVAAGSVVLPPAVQTSVAREIRLRHQVDRPALTRREQEILALVANDSATADIATRLHVSTATVKTHLQHVYEKLGVSDRAAAVAIAIRLELLE